MKKRNVYLVLLIIFSQFVFSSCISDWFGVSGKGDIIKESRSATNFQSIELLTSANVTIVKDTLFKIEVEDYENIVKYISAKVVAHSLIISISPKTLLLNSQAKVRISMPDSLIGLTISGSGNIDVDSTFKDIQILKVTGSGDININKTVNLANLTTKIPGSGNIMAKGTVKSLTAETAGSGNMNLSELVSDDAKCTITGSGNMYINALKTLDATISGSGDIQYYGNPTITKNITGSGNIVDKN